MDPATLAQQATDMLIPALPFIYSGGRAVADKSKDMLIEEAKKLQKKWLTKPWVK